MKDNNKMLLDKTLKLGNKLLNMLEGKFNAFSASASARVEQMKAAAEQNVFQHKKTINKLIKC